MPSGHGEPEHVLYRPGPDLHAAAQPPLSTVRGGPTAPPLLSLGHPARPGGPSEIRRIGDLRESLSLEPDLERPDRGAEDGPSARDAVRRALLGRDVPAQAALHPGHCRIREIDAH